MRYPRDAKQVVKIEDNYNQTFMTGLSSDEILRRGGPLSASGAILCKRPPSEHVGLVCRMAVGGIDMPGWDGTYIRN